ncbi:MAG: tetratricopeptide repeat protein [Gammaproteobacteria bacterium]|nr:tetratricopeptide repeat protein [Gammaproteobacteria bacterium]
MTRQSMTPGSAMTTTVLLMALNLSPHAVQAASSVTTAEVRKTQGVSELQQGNHEAALAYFREAVALNPEDTVASFYVGLMLSHFGQYDESRQYLQQALNNPAVATRARYELGYIHYRQRNYTEAITLLQQVVANSPEHLRGHYYLAISLRQQQQLEQALQHLQPVIAANRGLAAAAAYLRLGILYQQKGYREVTTEGEGYSKRYPDSPYQPQVDILRDKATAAMVRDKPWSLNTMAGLSYDTNVTIQPDHLQAGTEPETDKEDWRISLGADGRYTLYQQGPHRGRAGVKLSSSSHSDSQISEDFDTRRIGMVADYRYYHQGIFAGVEYNFGKSWLGGDDYLKNQSISPYYSFKPWPDQTSLIQMSWSQNDYLPEADLDSYDGKSSYLSYRHSLKHKERLYGIAVNLVNNSTNDEINNYSGGGVSADIRFVYGKAQMAGGVTYGEKKYRDNPLERRDKNISLNLGSTLSLGQRLTLEGLVTITDNNSSESEYTYQRQIVSANLRWKI